MFNFKALNFLKPKIKKPEIGTAIALAPQYNKTQDVAKTSQVPKDSPIMSLRTIFEDIRDGINNLVELTRESLMPTKDDMIGAANVTGNATKEELGQSGAPKFELPKPGPKVGLLLMLAGLALLFKFSEEIEEFLAKQILPRIKAAKDALGEKGALYLGLGLLAGILFPKTVTTLITTGITGAFKLLKAGFNGMKTAITNMPKLIKGARAGVTKTLGLLKGGFTALKGFITDKMIPGIKNAAGKGKAGIMFVVRKIRGAFMILRGFMLNTMIPAIKNAAGGVGGKLMKAVNLLKNAFVAVRLFLLGTMIPTITTMMAPFIIPLAAVVLAVAAAVAIFHSIKKGIDDFKKSLADGDSMLVAITEGVTTALLTLVTLPITLIKNFVAWVAGKLGFKGIEEKLKEFSIVDFIKNSIKTLVLKAVKFVQGLFDIDFMAVIGKFIDIGKKIGSILKGIAFGAVAALKAAFPGGESPMEAFKRVYAESTSGAEIVMPNEGDDSDQIDKEINKIETDIDSELNKVQKEANLRKGIIPPTITTIDNSTVKGGDSITQDNYNQVEFSSTHTDETAVLAVAGSLAQQ